MKFFYYFFIKIIQFEIQENKGFQMTYSKRNSIFQEARNAGCISISDLALFIKAKRDDRFFISQKAKYLFRLRYACSNLSMTTS